ncbi:VOC family protein [uncultured Agrobacterium sp.]|uniref:VOC family protein n=1 Tax=uncultured Agrobacterium sp. TaxID=157277 RepID=UPI0025FFA066|nr:VOC family protein [uncultured Agrobacterium sp.]
MSSCNNRIDYIEFNVGDIEVSKAFYGKVFGWTFKDYGAAYCEFSDGRLTGGFTTTAPVNAKGGALIILFADDIEAARTRVEDAGGRITVPIFNFPGGRRFHFEDKDGYELAVWSDQ